MKIYLSPSNQPQNLYCVGGTNEKAQMEAVAHKVNAILDSEYACDTVMATLNSDINARAVEAKNSGCDVYLAIHSNAGCSTASGAIALYHPSNATSKTFATNLVAELNAACPIKSNRSSPIVNGMAAFNGQGYGEVRMPTQNGMVSVLVETDFHDNPNTASWIINNKDTIARALVTGIAKTFGIAKKQVTPAPQPVPVSAGKLYKVQVGAYSVKANADNMLAKLKQAGFDGYIKFE